MPEEFPLPSSSYKELIKIIRAYGRIGGEAALIDVAKLAVINETKVSGNNKFLIALGIVTAGQKKAITPLGAELAVALEHEMPEEVAAKWRAVVNATEFLQNVVAAVRIRKTMDEASLESHVAYSAGQPKTPAVATGARTVVEILATAGVLKEEGGTLTAVAPEPRTIPETVEKSLSISDSMTVADSPTVQSSFVRGTRITGGVELNIDVTVQCTPADLKTWVKSYARCSDINEPEPKPDTPPQSPPASAAPPATGNGVAAK